MSDNVSHCLWCNKEIVNTRGTKKFCSPSHKVLYNRKNKPDDSDDVAPIESKSKPPKIARVKNNITEAVNSLVKEANDISRLPADIIGNKTATLRWLREHK